MSSTPVIRVEIAGVWPGMEIVIGLDVPPGTTVAEAFDASRIERLLGELPLGELTFSIFGDAVDGAFVLEAGDRIELVRPLQIDPKAARRRRAVVKASSRR